MRRGVLIGFAVVLAAAPRAQAQTDRCAISGTVSAGQTPLPGVVLTLTSDGRAIDVTSTAADGTYALRAPVHGDFVLSAELVAFATTTRSIAIDASHCVQRADLTMVLASRAPQTTESARRAAGSEKAPQAAPERAPRAAGSERAASQRTPAGRRPNQFQSLRLLADQNAAREDDQVDAPDAVQSVLPPGFSSDASGESVTSVGGAQATAPIGFGERVEFFNGGGPGGPDGTAFGNVPAFPGGPGIGGGFGPGGGGPGGGFGGPGPFGRRLGSNRIRGSVFENLDTSRLDAAPFSLNGQPTKNADYFQQRFGVTMGGPLTIPKISSGAKTFFFLNYTGNHASNPFDAYSTVPTEAERAGDLSALGRTIVDPSTGLPFAGNQIPVSRQNPSALSLLNLIPSPNQPGTRQNFHFLTSTSTNTDDVNLRLIHNFGDAPPPGQGRGRAAGGGRGAFAPGGGNVKNLNVTVHYRRQNTESASSFPSIGGSSRVSAWDIPASFTFTKGRIVNTLRVQYNRQRSDTQNLFAGVENVAGNAGLLGVSSDSFDWGAPSLAFSSIAGVNDVTPSQRINQTVAIGEQMIASRGRHTFRWGGDYRDVRMSSRSDPNARGSYVFTGLYTGLDFADFLLGLPQQASVQFGAGLERFRQTSWDLYLQDDWRVANTLTINAGLRYEYVSPFDEANNQLVNLDVTSNFTAAVPVQAGDAGPFFGVYPDSVVTPDRNNLAPRVGVAWRPSSSTVIRSGYGINYSTGVYQTIVQQLANQPPFARTDTIVATASAPIGLSDALLQSPTGVTSNSYGVDPLLRAPYVQIWNVDVQRELARTWNIGVGYIGTKGNDLDLLRAPNRGPSGLLIPGVQPFLWESSGASSLMNALTLRVRKRLTHGVAAGVAYTLSKSIDDAASIGGGVAVVAQNDLNLAAERGLSSFDQRHRLNANFTYELPFGPNRRWFNDGARAALFGGWVVNASAQFASGTPFTARVLSNAFDVSRGTNGTLRANYNGQPIDLADPTTGEFFNTAAFTIPAPGTFGDAGRNTIIGPGSSNVNFGVTRNLAVGENRVLSLQLMANNVFNTPQYSAIDTIVNSPTFGQVTAARAPRRLQILMRFRF